MPIAGSILLLQITEPVSSGKCGKNISYECEWAFRCQFFAAEAPCKLISYIFWLKPLKLVFSNLKSKFPGNIRIQYQRSMLKEGLFKFLTFDPC
jgi:hypothetical protein